MDEQQNDDWLETRLREEMPYIDDAGFTARVVRQLPARRPRRSFRAFILLSMAVLSAAIAYVVSGDGQFVTQGLVRIASVPMPMLFLVAIVSGILVTAFGLAAALSKGRDQLS